MGIRKGDVVQVLAGDDRGKRGKVLSVHPKKNKCVVEGINLVYKHVKPNRRNPQGGRLSKEMPLHISNVALLDPKDNKPTRVGVRILTDGSKERYAKRSGASLGKVAPPKEARKKLAAKTQGAKP
jgi:large subunit ribosomal protein L24